MWNQFPRTRLSLDDVIKVRITSMRDADVHRLKKWTQERDYGIAFATRVRTAIGRMTGKEED